jgi:xanthine dehydrogenase accessory factor
MSVHLVDFIHQCLSRGKPAVLIKITSQQGSSPRSAGTQMVVAADAQIHGTIGGGLLEARVIARAGQLLGGVDAQCEKFDLGQAEVAGMDMICGGGVDILYDPLSPTPDQAALFGRWRRMAAEGGEGVFVTVLRRQGSQITRADHALIESDGHAHGELPLTATALVDLLSRGQAARTMATLELEDYLILLEPIRKPMRAYVVGAGHVAQPTAHLAALVGFEVVVLDDRDTFANHPRFPDAHAVGVLADFQRTFEGWPVDRDTFIVIVTRGHLHDKVVLAEALKTDAAYIGMIGSRRKRDHIYQCLRRQGFNASALDRVHSPIGLDIGAETPAEIAVSIVAEMIAARRRLEK